MTHAFLNEKQVCERTSLSRSTIWRLRQAGDFPEPVKITERRVAYRAEDVEAWIADKGRLIHQQAGTA